MSVAPGQRFTRDHTCPICSGYGSLPRRQGQRCYGFLSADACYAHCTREELAGGIDADNAGTYAHRLNGSCRCGVTHGVAPPTPPPRPARVLSEDHFKDCEAGSPWDYTDATGRVLYRKCRHAGKRFAFYHRKGTGWTDDRGTSPVLLDLPLVRQAIAAGRSVFLVEGEKKARELQRLGLAATTNDAGALGFAPELAEQLRDASCVVIVLDNDPDGRERGERIPPLLHAVGVRGVRTLLIPGLGEGDGVDDWIALRYDQDREAVRRELVALAEAAPPWKPLAVEATGRMRITRMSDVKPRRLSWLWRHRIPLGMVTVFAGSGGLGKSTVLLDITAHVTTGRPMPDGCPGLGEPASVVIFTAEDALDSVVVPRLLLAGADLARIVTVGVKVGDGDERSLMVTPADLAHLETVVRAEGAKLVIFDPIISYVGADVNMHHSQDARRILAWLHRLAERLGIAVVGIHHWNKSQSPDPSMRLSGSAAIGQAARSVLVVGVDPQDSTSERRVLTLDKKNLAPPLTPSLAYRLVVDPYQDGTEGEHPRVEWLGTSSVTSRDLAAMPEDPDQRKVQREAEEWLREHLTEGPVPAAKAEAEGFDKRVMGRARQRVGVDAEQHARAWWWRLQKSPPDPWPWESESSPPHTTSRPEPPEQSQVSPSQASASGRSQVACRPEVRPEPSAYLDNGIGPPAGVRSSGPTALAAQPEPTNDPARPTCPACGGRMLRWASGEICTVCHRRFQDPDRGDAYDGDLEGARP